MNFAKLLHLPIVASAHGQDIDFIIYLVHILMFVLFVGWGIYFIFVLCRFNKWVNPKADYEGSKSHVTSYIEVTVVIIEALLLIGFSIPFWMQHINSYPNRKDIFELKVLAEQYAWNIHYPGADGKFGKTAAKFYDKQANPVGLDPSDPDGKDDFVTINQLYIPIGRPILIHLTSRDVMHSFSLPVMRVKQDVIPGMSIPTWFTPTKTGKWEIACAQLCGLGHYRMKGYINVLTQEDYDKWASQQATAGSDSGGGSDGFWN